MVLLWILLGLALLVLMISYICYRIVFYAKKGGPLGPDEYDIPHGKIYEPYRDTMIGWQKEVRRLPVQEFCITSFDGLKLYGNYYEHTPGAVIELMFHGYRGSAERDLCGGVQRAFALGHNALIVDQRTSGRSEGRVITFGIRESRDCRDWVEHAIGCFGPDVQIILTGISMGASTVLMAAGQPLPKNVIGVLADCGFTSAKAIMQVVIRGMKLPPRLLYPFVKLAAWLYGGFDLEADSALEAMSRCSVPVIFIHGEADDFVPCSMSKENYDACISHKQLVTIPGAGHGLCYPVAPKQYLRVLAEFFSDAKKSEKPEITA